MRHVFIINPTAGKRDCTAQMMAMAKALEADHGLRVDCILTRHAGHATETARVLCASKEPVRIYVCGGDGTINEVANAIAGVPHAAMTCVPVGTGNDFLKNFGDDAPRFAQAENLWNGPEFPLDAIDCNGRLALTIACSGFDAKVAEDVHTFGQSPLLGSRGSYIASLGVNFFLRSLGHSWTITLDDEVLSGEFALCSVCNGRYYGGGFLPVLEARMDDRMLNTIVVKKVSRVDFLRFIGAYSRGGYYKFPKYARCYTAKTITIDSPDEDIVTCLDGESVHNRRVELKLSDRRVNFFGPQGCDPNATSRPLPGKS